MSKKVIEKVIESMNLKVENIDSLGITTQRASILLFNKETGEPYTNIITWQDRRASKLASEISNLFNIKFLRGLTRFLTLFSSNPMFITASQLRFNSDHASARTGYLLNSDPELRKKAELESTGWGTIDTWIIYNLTQGKLHLTDYSNASATGLLDPFKLTWNSIVYKAFNIPPHIFPELRPTRGDFGTTELFADGPISIKSVVADQQASLFALFAGTPEIGNIKCTNGTGTFVDMFTGEKPKASRRKLYPLIAWTIKDDEGKLKTYYLLEGLSHNTGNIIDFIKDIFKLYDDPADTEKMAMSVDSTDGVFFLPALTSGLSFPIWDNTTRGNLFGLSLNTKPEHIVRAVLEGICFRIKDIVEGIMKDAKIKIDSIVADGGVSQNKFVLQFMSDILGLNVVHYKNPETTALGAAFLAGLETGFWKIEQLKDFLILDKIYTPKMSEDERKKRYACWKDIISRSLNYKMT